MKSFDEWYREAKKLNNDGFPAKDFFKAGQQSKQAEVDELQKRIDDITHKLKNIKNDTLRSHRYDYDKGWRDCAITTLNDLKGDSHES